MSINNNIQAFPSSMARTDSGIITSEDVSEGGMSLRDYFAAKAFPYQLTMEVRPYEDYNYLNAAKRAYRMADAMLKAREDEP